MAKTQDRTETNRRSNNHASRKTSGQVYTKKRSSQPNGTVDVKQQLLPANRKHGLSLRANHVILRSLSETDDASFLARRSSTPTSVLMQRPSPPTNCSQFLNDYDNGSVNGSVPSLNSVSNQCTLPASGSIFNFQAAKQVDKNIQNKLTDDVDALTNSLHKKDLKQSGMHEWQFASMVVDRVFLISFVFTLTSSVLFLMLHKMPHVPDE